MITLEDISKNPILGATYEALEEFQETLNNELDSLKVSDTGDLTYRF